MLREAHGLPRGGREGHLGGRPAAAAALRLRLQPVILSFQLLYFTLRRGREKPIYHVDRMQTSLFWRRDVKVACRDQVGSSAAAEEVTLSTVFAAFAVYTRPVGWAGSVRPELALGKSSEMGLRV